MTDQQKAVILTGGGARAAYQVGVLKAISDICPDLHYPFDIICGTSAGAINAIGLASGGDIFRHNISRIESLWSQIKTEQVYRTDLWGLTRRLAHFTKSLMRGESEDHPASLLDNAPLRPFLEEHINFDAMKTAIENGDIRSVCVTACGYRSGQSINFFQSDGSIDSWHLGQRLGVSTTLTIEHLLASSAIPLVFPPIKIHREYFGDGVIRQMAPLSPAIHLGAKKIFIIGVSANKTVAPKRQSTFNYPSLSNVLEHVLNGVFIDTIEHDIDRAHLINSLLTEIPDKDRKTRGIPLQPLDLLEISPSQPIDEIAHKHQNSLPKNIQRLTGSSDNANTGSSLASYILFEGDFCRDLITLGYQDAKLQARRIERFFTE